MKEYELKLLIAKRIIQVVLMALILNGLVYLVFEMI